MTSSKLTRERFDAVLFDMDGVLTATMKVHAASWKRMFDAYLKDRSDKNGEAYQPFDMGSDYKKYVDGKLRNDGVQSFLLSRGIDLPWGDPEDPPDRETVCGLGNRKNVMVNEVIDTDGVDVYTGAVAFARHVRGLGMKTAVVSASRNCVKVLEAAGIGNLMDARVDGVVAGAFGLPGKPEPDTYLKGAELLETSPERTIVIEDAISGVQAGRAGGFGFVIGIDHHDDPEVLTNAGADLVVKDLGELLEG